MTRNRKLAGALLAAGALAVTTAPSALAANADEAFNRIKQIEAQLNTKFGVPTPSTAIDVATFNFATGAKSGRLTQTVFIDQDGDGRKETRTQEKPSITIDGVNAKLVFKWANNTGTVTIRVNGRNHSFAASAKKATIDIGRARFAGWRMSSGARSLGDTLDVKRKHVLGVGAFRIKALPMAVVYEPPQDPGRTNSALYSRSVAVDTRLDVGFLSKTATERKIAPDLISQQNMEKVLKAAAKVFLPAAEQYIDLGAIVGETQKTVVDEESTEVRTSQTVGFRATVTHGFGAHLGPGRGDAICVLKDAVFVWFDDGQRTQLSLIGDSGHFCPTVETLKNHTSGLLDAATESALLPLDPFATGGPGAVLPASRFTEIEPININSTEVQTREFQESLRSEQAVTESNARVTTEKIDAGLLARLGVGPSESKTVRTTVGTSNTLTNTATVTKTLTVQLRTLRTGESSTIRAYYDRTFGTIALQDPRTVGVPVTPTEAGTPGP
jgi:hypothetical protein